MAHKLALLFYRLLKHGQQYVDQGAEFYQERHRERQIRAVQKRARQLGLKIINPTPTPLNPAPPGLPA